MHQVHKYPGYRPRLTHTHTLILVHTVQVEALPTLILFYKGEVLGRFVGHRSADELEKEVRTIIGRLPK